MSVPAWLAARPIAHRGLHDATAGWPENSLSAFARAAEAGYPIEFDVSISADGDPVVFHDAALERMTGVAGNVARTPTRDLTRLRLLETGETIPRLEDVLELIAGRVPMFVEIKNRGLRVGRPEGAVARVLERYDGHYAVSSFNPRTVRWLARHMPHVPRGQNVMRFRGGGIWPGGRHRLSLRQLLSDRISRPQFIGCDVGSLPHPTAEHARRRGILLIVFTVRNREHRALVEKCADNMFFEGFVP